MPDIDVGAILDQVIKLTGKVNVALPLLVSAYKLCYGIWREAHPTGTFEEFNASLLEHSTAVVGTSEMWFLTHGYRWDEAQGSWVK